MPITGQTPIYEYSKPNGEHMFNAPLRELDLSRLEEDKEAIVNQIVRFYEAAAPIAAKMKTTAIT